MSDYQFIRSYFEDFSDLLQPNEELIEKLIQIRDLLLEVNKNNIRNNKMSKIRVARSSFGMKAKKKRRKK